MSWIYRLLTILGDMYSFIHLSSIAISYKKSIYFIFLLKCLKIAKFFYINKNILKPLECLKLCFWAENDIVKEMNT